MAIDLTGLSIIDSDFLKSGFRVKYNMSLDKMITGVSVVGGSILKLTTPDNSFIQIDLGEYFYSIADINELFIVAYATDEVAGKIRIGTLEEVQELSLNNVAVTPYSLGQLLYYYNGKGFVAAEDLAAGDFVCIFFDEEEEDETIQWKIKKALADDKDTMCRGFTLEDILEGEMGPIKMSGNINSNLGELEPYKYYYLKSVPPDIDNLLQISTEKPTDTGTYVQQIGYAISETELMVELHPEEINLGDVFEELPSLLFVKGVEMTVGLQLEDYLIEGIDPESLSYSFLGVPYWITETSVVFNYLSFTGTGVDIGQTTVLMEVSSGVSKRNIEILVLVISPPIVSFLLSPGGILIPRKPVTLPYDPPYTLTIGVEGGHDAYQWVYRHGGAVVEDSGDVPVAYTETATYTPIDTEALAEGIHVVFFRLFRQTGVDESDDPIYTEIYGNDVIFNLGTTPENPDMTVAVRLVSGGDVLGLLPGVFNYVESWDLVPVPRGIKYDELVMTLLPEDAPFTATLVPVLTAESFTVSSDLLNAGDGTLSANAGYRTTSLIAVTENQEYWTEDAYAVVGYLSGVYVADLTGDVILIPAGIDEIRVCWATAAGDVDLVGPPGTMFDGDTAKGDGEFTLFIRAYLSGSQVYERMVSLMILPEETTDPEPQTGIILLGHGSPAPATNLPLSGYVTTLPTSWQLLFNGFGAVLYDRIYWKVLYGMGAMTELNIPLYTAKQPEKTYPDGTYGASQLLFWGKTSLQMGAIHASPMRIVAEVIGEFAGEKIAIAKSDWIFSNEPLGDTSGVAFLTVTVEDDEVTDADVVESNIPESGQFYQIPAEDGKFYGLLATEIDGIETFDQVVSELDGNIMSDVSFTETDTITSPDQLLALTWDRVAGTDAPGLKTFVQTFYLASVVVAVVTITLTLYTEEPEIKDPNDCCGEGGGATKVDFTAPSTEWTWNHGWGRTPIIKIIIGGEEWQSRVVHSGGDNTTTIFFNSPRAGYIVAE